MPGGLVNFVELDVEYYSLMLRVVVTMGWLQVFLLCLSHDESYMQ